MPSRPGTAAIPALCYKYDHTPGINLYRILYFPKPQAGSFVRVPGLLSHQVLHGWQLKEAALPRQGAEEDGTWPGFPFKRDLKVALKGG